MEDTLFEWLPQELLRKLICTCGGQNAYVLSEFTQLPLDETFFLHKINESLASVFGHQVVDIKNYMKERGIILSGSFIIQALLNEDWQSDIDFYTLSSSPKAWQNLPKEFIPPNSKKMDNHSIDRSDEYYNYMNSLHLSAIHNFSYSYVGNQLTGDSCRAAHLQLVELDIDKVLSIIEDTENTKAFGRTDCIWQYINTEYDFDVCKCIYYIEKGREYVKIANYHSIYQKKISLSKVNVVTLYDRVKKYIHRGFAFDIPAMNPLPKPHSWAQLLLLKQDRASAGEWSYKWRFTHFIEPGTYQLYYDYRAETGVLSKRACLKGGDRDVQFLLLPL